MTYVGRAMQAARSVALAATALILSGCMLYHTAPQDTQILDAVSRNPVPGALVQAWPEGRQGEAKIFTAGEDGRVKVPSLTFFIPLPGDAGLHMPLTMRIIAKGYATLLATELRFPDPIELKPEN